MAKMSCSIEASIGTRVRDSKVVSEELMDDVLDLIWYRYPQYDLPEDDPDRVLLPKTPANIAKAYDDFVDGYFQGLASAARKFKQKVAGKVAEDAIPEIDL
jgi:hypothetical protein